MFTFIIEILMTMLASLSFSSAAPAPAPTVVETPVTIEIEAVAPKFTECADGSLVSTNSECPEPVIVLPPVLADGPGSCFDLDIDCSDEAPTVIIPELVDGPGSCFDLDNDCSSEEPVGALVRVCDVSTGEWVMTNPDTLSLDFPGGYSIIGETMDSTITWCANA